MSSRKRQRMLRDRNNILKYIVSAFIICVITTYFIYKKVTSPHTGGIPRVFLEEMTSNVSRDILDLGFKGWVSDRINSTSLIRRSRNTLIYVWKQFDMNRIENCFSDKVKSTKNKILNTSRFSCKHIMNLTGSLGRTGNQMFQVAALLGTAYKHNFTPIIPPSFPLTRWFDLPNVSEMRLENSKKFYLKNSGAYTDTIDNLDLSTNWTLHGYFQSWKFFSGAEHIVKDAFRLKDKYRNVAKKYLRNVTKPGYSNVCVHVRRGDLNTKDLLDKGYSLPGLGYIYRAMEFFRKQFGNKVQFIVLSDGMFWCLDNIHGHDVIFSPFYDTPEDLALMTLCDHVIVSSGTFGWWGAWLSGGHTVYFKGYPRKNSWLEKQLNSMDYYPPDWIGLW